MAAGSGARVMTEGSSRRRRMSGPCASVCWGAATSVRPCIRLIHEHAEDVARKVGARLEIARWPCATPCATEACRSRRDRFTDDAGAVVDDPGIDIVCELMGGVEPARGAGHARPGERQVRRDGEQRASGEAWGGAFAAADRAGGDLDFEAAVAGGIPLIRPLKGITGGGTGRSHPRHRERNDQLHPHADVRARVGVGRGARRGAAARVRGGRSDGRRRGYDAAAKCAILASVAFDARVVADDVYREGSRMSPRRTSRTRRRLGYVVKLLAIAELEDEADHGPGAPGDDPRVASARRGPRRVQRGLRRGPKSDS